MFNFITLSSHSIGGVTLDAVLNEEHESTLTVTQNPIESGAEIADHAFLNPKAVTISGVVVDYSPKSALGVLGQLPFIRETENFLNAFPLPYQVKHYTTQAMGKLNQITGAVQGVMSKVEEARALAPWLPDFNASQLLGFSEGNRVQQCYADLVKLQKSGEPLEINTGISLYKNMVIESLSVSQDKLGSAVFTVQAREIFIVDTAVIKNKPSASKKSTMGKAKSGRASTQGAKKFVAGKTQLMRYEQRSPLPKVALGAVSFSKAFLKQTGLVEKTKSFLNGVKNGH